MGAERPIMLENLPIERFALLGFLQSFNKNSLVK